MEPKLDSWFTSDKICFLNYLNVPTNDKHGYIETKYYIKYINSVHLMYIYIHIEGKSTVYNTIIVHV